MFAIPAALIGAIIGWRMATRRNGNVADKWQYAIAMALLWFLIALALTIAADWQGWV